MKVMQPLTILSFGAINYSKGVIMRESQPFDKLITKYIPDLQKQDEEARMQAAALDELQQELRRKLTDANNELQLQVDDYRKKIIPIAGGFLKKVKELNIKPQLLSQTYKWKNKSLFDNTRVKYVVGEEYGWAFYRIDGYGAGYYLENDEIKFRGNDTKEPQSYNIVFSDGRLKTLVYTPGRSCGPWDAPIEETSHWEEGANVVPDLSKDHLEEAIKTMASICYYKKPILDVPVCSEFVK
jgi:hypothetical protein